MIWLEEHANWRTNLDRNAVRSGSHLVPYTLLPHPELFPPRTISSRAIHAFRRILLLFPPSFTELIQHKQLNLQRRQLLIQFINLLLEPNLALTRRLQLPTACVRLWCSILSESFGANAGVDGRKFSCISLRL